MKMDRKLSVLMIAGLAALLGFSGFLTTTSKVAAVALQATQAVVLQPPIPLIASEADEIFRVPAQPRNLTLNPHATAFVINYLPAGTTDPWGQPCYTWPKDAKTAFSYAATLWSAILNSEVPITIEACWADMGTYLGYSAAYSTRNFPDAPLADTEYFMALADALAGYDLDPTYADMYITYNGNSTIQWYFGIDGNTPLNAYDFVSVVLHEICHGLNFGSAMNVSGSNASWGTYPGIYDRFAQNGDGVALLNFPNNSSQLAAQLTSNQVYFNGANARAANGGNLVRLYAPSAWQPGSSYFHLDQEFNGTENTLMTYSISNGESVHDPGPVTRGMLRDMGWPDAPPPIPTHTPTATVTPTPTLTGSPTNTLTPTRTATHPDPAQTQHIFLPLVIR